MNLNGILKLKKRQGELSGTPCFIGGWLSGLAASDVLACPQYADITKCKRRKNPCNYRKDYLVAA